MDVEIKRPPAGLLQIVLNDPPGPSLVMDDLTDREVCEMAQYIYSTAAQSDDWDGPVAITFVDLGGRAMIHTARATDWRRMVVGMLRACDPAVVLETVHPAGYA